MLDTKVSEKDFEYSPSEKKKKGSGKSIDSDELPASYPLTKPLFTENEKQIQ